MQIGGHRARYVWFRRFGIAALCSSALLALLLAVSARWWFGYCSESWLVDLGDGALYTQRVRSNTWAIPVLGWYGEKQQWNWTWWTWGARTPAWRESSAYTIWPIAPLLMIIGLVLIWPSHRVRTRLRKNLCIRCGYSREGLSAQNPCPECGVVAIPRAGSAETAASSGSCTAGR